MLRIDLGLVRAGAVETPGQVEASDPLWKGTDITLAGPLRIDGRFSSAGEGKYYWHARIAAVLRQECRRCLTPVETPLSQDLQLVFVAEEDALDDDVGCYVIPSRAAELDLRGAVREELVLAMPHFVECRPDCRGLCPECGANLNAGPCGCRTRRDPRWGALDGLLPGRADKD